MRVECSALMVLVALDILAEQVEHALAARGRRRGAVGALVYVPSIVTWSPPAAATATRGAAGICCAEKAALIPIVL